MNMYKDKMRKQDENDDVEFSQDLDYVYRPYSLQTNFKTVNDSYVQ